MSATVGTKNTFFERLYWVSDWAHLGPQSTVPNLPQLYPFTQQARLSQVTRQPA